MSNMFHRVAKGFVNNFKTIIQALVFSVIIWVFISVQIFPDVSIHITDIPLKCEPTTLMTEEDLQIVSVDTSKVTVLIRGKRYSISRFSKDNFEAVCDLSRVYEAGEFDVPIDITLNDTAEDCQIVTDNLSAKVKVIKIVSREMELIPNTDSLAIADEMQIEGEVTASPSVITITGEESLVNSIGHIEAVASYDGTLDHSEGVSANLEFFNTSGIKIARPDLTYNSNDIVVSVPVYKIKTLPVQVRFTGTIGNSSFDPDDLDYSMSINEITIGSPDSSTDKLDAIDIGEISLAALTLKDLQGGVTLPVELPDGYKNISGNRTITVTFPDADNFGQLGFTVPSENFTIINNPSKYDVKVLTNQIVVNVVGYSDYIQTMTSSDIYATINLLGVDISEGSKSVSVTFRLKGSNVRAWVTGEEYKVDLLITQAAEDEEQ